MRVLVFGATGFLGRALVETIMVEGDSVTAIGRPSSAVPKRAASIPFTLGQGFPRPDIGPHDAAVFLAQSPAYAKGLVAAPEVLAVNAVGLAEALEISRAAGVSRFLNASSGSVYSLSDQPRHEGCPADATGVYALSKRFGEELLEAWAGEFSTLSMRFFALYGAGQEDKMVPGLAGRMRRGDSVTLAPRSTEESAPGGFRTSPCFVGDAVAAVRALLDKDCRGVLNVAGGEALSVREMATLIGRRIGREPTFEISPEPRAGDLVADVAELRRLCGVPRVSFEQGLIETFPNVSLG